MITNLITKVFGSKHERDIKRIRPIVDEINRIFATLRELSDDELRAKTAQFKERIAEKTEAVRGEITQVNAALRGEQAPQNGREDAAASSSIELREKLLQLEDEERRLLGEILDEILPQAYAVVKETCRRLCGQRWEIVGHEIEWDMVPFDVQLIGGVVLHEGKIAEMATGEGKTLVATMPLYLNALAGKGVHLVTVNDYLARRDCEWMGKIYEFLGLRTAYITNDMNPPQRRVSYAADITYGTNNEFGFDYLRDNMAGRPEDQVQRGHYFAIIDEVDSVLVDEARTPLIISGPVEQNIDQYNEMKPRVERLINAQTALVNKFVAEVEKLLEEKKDYDAGIKLLTAQRGAPKNKRLLKVFQEVGAKKLMREVENDYLRDKRMPEIDEQLYFAIDEKQHTIDLTEMGRDYLSPNDKDLFVLPDLSEKLHEISSNESLGSEEKEKKKEDIQKEYTAKSERLHSISQLLRAYSLFEKDVEYVVSDGKVLIVDEFTGRLMPGRRYSDGLHQALEAKENVKVEGETQTLATITLQNYFRMYSKLAGMTGTAETEAAEFWDIYKLDVVVIPTNEPVRRTEHEDQIFRTKREKYNAVVKEVLEMHKMGRPVLVGTISVEVSELLDRMLDRVEDEENGKKKKIRIPHKVLNAKYHKEEAEIVTLAGQPGAVTIATNMAGRGTDIKLGPGVVESGGLHIIGTERHEARRIDRQLRGRSGRQGDPGSSRFYLSLEDDLMRLFGSDRIASIMDRLGAQEGEVITHAMVTRSIGRAQKRVEGHNFQIRKHLLEYDDVMSQQREVIYDRRSHALRGDDLRDEVLSMIDEVVAAKVEKFTQAGEYAEDWDWEGLRNSFQKLFLTSLPVQFDDDPGIKAEELTEKLRATARDAYFAKEKLLTPKMMRELERFAMLRVIDERWREHLYEMDHLKEGIGLRAYGQKDPLLEYKGEGFRMFKEMLDLIDEQVIELIFKLNVAVEPTPSSRRMPRQMSAMHHSSTGMGFQALGGALPRATEAPPVGKRQPIVVEKEPGRNDPCPCGSGKKYKKCHGAV